MSYFDRFDICEAYQALESDYNVGGWLPERPSNRRRSESIDVQLMRMKFKPRPSLDGTFANLTENGKDIYCELVRRYELPADEEVIQWESRA